MYCAATYRGCVLPLHTVNVTVTPQGPPPTRFRPPTARRGPTSPRSAPHPTRPSGGRGRDRAAHSGHGQRLTQCCEPIHDPTEQPPEPLTNRSTVPLKAFTLLRFGHLNGAAIPLDVGHEHHSQSVRQVVRVTEGGDLARIRLSNAYGTSPPRIAVATIARTTRGAGQQRGQRLEPPGRRVRRVRRLREMPGLDAAADDVHHGRADHGHPDAADRECRGNHGIREVVAELGERGRAG